MNKMSSGGVNNQSSSRTGTGTGNDVTFNEASPSDHDSAVLRAIENLRIDLTQKIDTSEENLMRKISSISTKVDDNERRILDIEVDQVRLNKIQVDHDHRVIAVEATCTEITELKKNYEEVIKKAEIKALVTDQYNKRLNMIVGGLLKVSLNAWETFEECEKLVRDFLKNVLKYKNADTFTIVDVHRLRTRNVDTTKPKPMIFKVATVEVKRDIMKCTKNLKDYNNDKTIKAYVSDHLPKAMQLNRKALLPTFYKKKEEGLKPGWQVDVITGEYCVKVPTGLIHPP